MHVGSTTVQQIQEIVTCAAEADLSVSAKSGGHSYGAFGLAGDVVIDMKNMKGLTLNSDGTAVVQTGNRLGEVAQGIFDMGQRALPHGSCPYVRSMSYLTERDMQAEFVNPRLGRVDIPCTEGSDILAGLVGCYWTRSCRPKWCSPTVTW